MSGTDSETEVRVLQLITRFIGGGAETTAENVLEALDDAPESYDCRLATGAEYDHGRLDALSERGVDTAVFSSIRHYNPFSAVLAVFAVGWYLRREEIDVVHTHGTEAGIIGSIAGWLAGTPTIIREVHGDPITADRSRLLNWFLLGAERRCAPLVTRIVVKSERIRETYLARGIGRPEQYECIRIGVELARFCRERAPGQADESVTVEDGGPVRLLFVGRLAAGKGLMDLLAAVERFDAETVRLDIVGDGPLREELRAAVVKRNLGGMVEFHGYRDDVPAVMAASDVFVLPSYREGTPRVIAEAQASRLPVVATDIAGIPEMVRDGETGFLVTPGDVEALGDRIRELVTSSELRRRMADRAYDDVPRFARETTLETYRRLYRDLSSAVR